jgi:hypothetical protein
MNILDHVTSKGLHFLVAVERDKAATDARKQGAWIRSRGTYLTTSNGRDQLQPRPASECPDWKGTLKEIRSLIALVSEKYPEVTRISIEGGYDCADTFQDLYEFDNYEPMVTWWEVLVWAKDSAS